MMLSFRGSTVTLCGWLNAACEHGTPRGASAWPPRLAELPPPQVPATVVTRPVASSTARMQEAKVSPT